MEDVTIFLAFAAGFLSFISPCCLPLYPAFLSYVTGMSISEVNNEQVMLQRRSILHTVFFLIGFSVVFIALGFTTSFVGSFFYDYQDAIRQFGAIFLVFFGLVVIGFFRPKFLMKGHTIQFKNRPTGYFGSILIGIAFAAGWTPCTGPILGAVLSMAATDPDQGVVYLSMYSLGFSVPFFIMSFFIGRMKNFMKYSERIMKFGGWVMILMGILLFFDLMTDIIAFFTTFMGGFTGF